MYKRAQVQSSATPLEKVLRRQMTWKTGNSSPVPQQDTVSVDNIDLHGPLSNSINGWHMFMHFIKFKTQNQ